MGYFKIVNGIYLDAIGTGDTGTPITGEEYGGLLEIIRSGPTPEDGYTCKLRADTLEWEQVELPPAPEPADDAPADAADYESALNRLGVEV